MLGEWMSRDKPIRGVCMNSVGCLIFCFFVAVPSLAMIERFILVVSASAPISLRSWLTFAVQLGYLLALLVIGGQLFTRIQSLRFRLGGWTVMTVLLLLLMAFLVVYPAADSGRLGFYSDRDEAIDVAVRQLVVGDHPYRCKAVSGVHDGCPDSGNPIAPLPGALILSAPFVLTWGGSAIQSFFWLAVFYFASRRYTADAHLASLHLLLLMALSPVLIAEILTGGDLIANTLAVTSLVLLALGARTFVPWLVFGLLLGVALSWRAHFLLIAVPLVAYHLRRGEIEKLLTIGLAAAVSFLAVTVPLWYADPGAFSPLLVQRRFDEFSHLLPHGNVVVVILAALLGAVLGRRAQTNRELLVACGMTLILPFLIAVTLNSISLGRPTFLFFGWYAMSSLFLGTLGAFMMAADRADRAPHHA